MKKCKKNVFVLLFLNAVILVSCEQPTVEESLVSVAPVPKGSTVEMADYTLSKWMSFLDGTKKISEFSLPGTHDSGARYEPYSGLAKCQNLSITDQLNTGVRFLDIRCRHFYETLVIQHGVIYQFASFTDVLNSCTDFLKRNPSETIIMSVKEEYNAVGCKQSFEKTFDSYVKKNPGLWYLGDAIPTLNTVKGKIVLVRRFDATVLPKGITATGWRDDATFEINTSQSQMKIQDRYAVSNLSNKWNAIKGLADEARVGNKNTLYLNYTSGFKYRFWKIPSVTLVSNDINPRINNYFNGNPKGRFGVIVMDFANPSRNDLIIKSNFK